MSSTTPEWMEKFQEIGQKEDEEVTAIGKRGFVKTAESFTRRNSNNSGTTTTDNATTKVTTNTNTNNPGDEAKGDDVIVDDAAAADDDVAAMFHSARSEDPPGESSSEHSVTSNNNNNNNNNNDNDHYNDHYNDNAAPVATEEYVTALASSSATEPPSNGGRDDYEEEVEEEEEETNDDDEILEEDFGASWVVDETNLKGGVDVDDVDEAGAGAGARPRRESYVYYDSDGNEMLVDENGDEILPEEDVLVDDDDNDILSDQDIQQLNRDADGPVAREPSAIVTGFRPSTIVAEFDYSDSFRSEGFQKTAPRASIDREEERTAVVQSTVRLEAASVPVPAPAPVNDIEEQRRILGIGKGGKRSRMSWCIPILVFAILAAAILLVVIFVVFNEDSAISGVTPTMAPTATGYLPLEPTASSRGTIDAAATTEFDPIQNSCDFDSLGLVQPNVIDQCNCGEGYVDILADDVLARRADLVKKFIPSIYPQWNEPTYSCSPENRALLWLSSGINNGGEIDNVLRLQRYALTLVYYQQGGTEWRRSTNWLSEKSICEWEGVECDNNSYVRILSLDQNRLTGQFSDAPTLLNAIEGYFVANNNLIGSISESYFNSDSLRSIDFSNNALSGEISSKISKETKLTNINFASNNLNGTLPRQIRKIAGLAVLNVESNAFSGKLPASLFGLPLIDLAIGGNSFEGTIPADLPNVSTLTSLSLGPNLFTGDIPTSLNELTNLVRLSMMGIPDLGGRLPASYGLSLTDLVELSISETSVGGDIPDQFSLMTSLKTLRLSSNSLRGKIPSSLGLLTNLENLHLNENDLSGTIPSEMGLLSALQELQFHTNRFIGTIPEEIGNLVEIRSLTFDGNVMDGRVPNGVCALRDAELNTFIVDCPTLVGESQVDGIICSIPDCCTECL